MIDPLTLTPEMAALAARLGPGGSGVERARRLYHAILDEDLHVAYNENMTLRWRPQGCKSARAVFEEVGPQGRRFAMCIEYTLLFLALGREIGLNAVAMRDEASQGETDGFVFGHIVAGVWDGEGWRVVDLTNRRFWRDPAGFAPLSDDRLRAYFFNNSGLIFRAQGRLPEAEAAISAALAYETGHGAFWYNRGCVRLVSGNALAARDDLGQAAALAPHNASILTNLAVAHNVLGQKATARLTFCMARELAPHDARIAYNLGVLAYEESEYEVALTHWRDAVAADPRYAPARRSLGHLLRALGHPDEGTRILASLPA